MRVILTGIDFLNYFGMSSTFFQGIKGKKEVKLLSKSNTFSFIFSILGVAHTPARSLVQKPVQVDIRKKKTIKG